MRRQISRRRQFSLCGALFCGARGGSLFRCFRGQRSLPRRVRLDSCRSGLLCLPGYGRRRSARRNGRRQGCFLSGGGRSQRTVRQNCHGSNFRRRGGLFNRRRLLRRNIRGPRGRRGRRSFGRRRGLSCWRRRGRRHCGLSGSRGQRVRIIARRCLSGSRRRGDRRRLFGAGPYIGGERLAGWRSPIGQSDAQGANEDDQNQARNRKQQTPRVRTFFKLIIWIVGRPFVSGEALVLA